MLLLSLLVLRVVGNRRGSAEVLAPGNDIVNDYPGVVTPRENAVHVLVAHTRNVLEGSPRL